MKRLGYVGLCAGVVVLALSVTAGASGAVVTFPTPRDGTLFFVTNNVPADAPIGPTGTYVGSPNYNDIESNWYQHPLSDQNPGFFQINDGGTVTSAIGGWNPGGTAFTLTVTGTNASYANSYARLWHPAANDAWGGTFTSYTYTITATGMTSATTAPGGWQYNTSDPTGITGSFDATYVADVNPANPLANNDTLVVHLDFNKAYWDGTNWSNTYGAVNYGNYSYFGAGEVAGAFVADSNQFGYQGTVEDPSVPEPISMIFFGTGLVAVGGYVARRRMQKTA